MRPARPHTGPQRRYLDRHRGAPLEPGDSGTADPVSAPGLPGPM